MSSGLAASPAVDRRTRMIGIAAAISAISAVGTSISLGLPLLGIVLDDRGITSSEIGLNAAMGGVAALAITPFVPRFAQKVGAARLLLFALIVLTGTFPLFFVFDSIIAWYPLRFVFTAALTTAFILSEFWINALAPDGKRGLILGVYATVLSLGFMVGPVILGVVGADGFTPFLIGTIILGVSSIPVLFALGANPAMEDRPHGSFLRYLWLVPLATFAGFAFGAVDSGMLGFAAIYGLRVGFEERTAALLVSAMAFGNVVSQIPLGLLADRVDRRKLLLAISALSAVAILALPLAGANLWLVLAMIAVFGGISAGLYTVGLVHLGARLRGSDLAAANAGFVFMYALGMLIGPAATGAGMDIWNPHGLSIVIGSILIGYALFAVWRIATVGRRPLPGQTPQGSESKLTG